MSGTVKGKFVIQSYKALEAACADLRYEVEHQGEGGAIILLGSTYRATDPNAIKTLTMDGIEVGYQLKATARDSVFARIIFVRVKGHQWHEVPKKDSDRKAKAFFVPVVEIRENKYDLSINRYKEIAYEEVQYDPPLKILDQLESLEAEITADLKELRGMEG